MLRPAAACEECPVRKETDDFKQSCRDLLYQRVYKGGARAAWSVENLTATVERISSLAAAAGDSGYDGDWTVMTARLVSNFRHERNKMRRIDDYNEEQERKQRER